MICECGCECRSEGRQATRGKAKGEGGGELTCLTGRILKKFFQIIFRGETCTDRLSSFTVTWIPDVSWCTRLSKIYKLKSYKDNMAVKSYTTCFNARCVLLEIGEIFCSYKTCAYRIFSKHKYIIFIYVRTRLKNKYIIDISVRTRLKTEFFCPNLKNLENIYLKLKFNIINFRLKK